MLRRNTADIIRLDLICLDEPGTLRYALRFQAKHLFWGSVCNSFVTWLPQRVDCMAAMKNMSKAFFPRTQQHIADSGIALGPNNHSITNSTLLRLRYRC